MTKQERKILQMIDERKSIIAPKEFERIFESIYRKGLLEKLTDKTGIPQYILSVEGIQVKRTIAMVKDYHQRWQNMDGVIGKLFDYLCTLLKLLDILPDLIK